MGRAVRFLLAAAFALWAIPAAAEPIYLSGTVGKAPVFIMLERKETEVSGWYLYLRQGKEIRLEGTIDAAGKFSLTETPAGAGAPSGYWTGTVHGSGWSGWWAKLDESSPAALALNENRDTLAALSIQISCRAKPDRIITDYSFDQSLDLALSAGRVSRFSTSHRSRGKGDEQDCGVDLRDLDRVPSRAGILFRAKGDDAADPAPHCSVRVLAMGDYLYVQMGDFTEDGNDCAGVGEETRFCSPRGNFNDLIVDRRTGTCRMVE